MASAVISPHHRYHVNHEIGHPHGLSLFLPLIVQLRESLAPAITTSLPPAFPAKFAKLPNCQIAKSKKDLPPFGDGRVEWRNRLSERSYTAFSKLNCSVSVEPSNAVVDDFPLAITCVTSSKYPVPTNRWWRTAP